MNAEPYTILGHNKGIALCCKGEQNEMLSHLLLWDTPDKNFGIQTHKTL